MQQCASPNHEKSVSSPKALSNTVINCSMLPLLKYVCCQPLFDKYNVSDYKTMFAKVSTEGDNNHKAIFIKLVIDCAIYNGAPILDMCFIDAAKSLISNALSVVLGQEQTIGYTEYTRDITCDTCEKRITSRRMRFTIPISNLVEFMSHYPVYADESMGVPQKIIQNHSWARQLNTSCLFYFKRRDALARFPVYNNYGFDIWILKKVDERHGVCKYDTGISLYFYDEMEVRILPYETAAKSGMIFIEDADLFYRRDLILTFIKTRQTAHGFQLPCKVARLVFKRGSCAVPFET